MSEKYANFEWAVFEREANLSELFDEAESRLRSAGSDENAKAIIDRALRSIGDGHLRVKWPAGPAGAEAANSGAPTDVCAALGYDAGMRAGRWVPTFRATARFLTMWRWNFPRG